MRTIVLCVLTSAAIGLAGCSTTEVVPPTMNVSVGQQLIDLKHAHDNGALSDDEYQRQRKQLIDSVR
jgi:hypothetical protein